jgi:pimeloyl-ACP methyl ester carboxylesterase
MDVNGVELCVETFGAATAPPVLLVGNTMLTWPDDLCTELARDRRVIRYDLRGTGRSTTHEPEAPDYSLRDLVADAAALLDGLAVPRAHVVGYATGGFIAQLLALDHPDRVASLTLIATRPTAPGPADADLPEHSPAIMKHVMEAPEPDWTDCTAVIDYFVDSRRLLANSPGFDEAEAREQVERIYDRTPTGPDPAPLHRSNQLASAFGAMDSGDRWRERLPEVQAPTLVIHGANDPFFPLGNGEALAAEIPSAELLVLPDTGQELPRRSRTRLLDAIRRHTS